MRRIMPVSVEVKRKTEKKLTTRLTVNHRIDYLRGSIRNLKSDNSFDWLTVVVSLDGSTSHWFSSAVTNSKLKIAVETE